MRAASISPFNDVLVLLYWYLHEVRGERGGVVRNLSPRTLLDRLAQALGETCYEVPVGFKHIAATMVEHNAVLGGEIIRRPHHSRPYPRQGRHFRLALVVEMLARTGLKIIELQERVYALTGRLYSVEESFPATPEMRIAVPRRLKETPCSDVAGYPVERISHMDGTKLLPGKRQLGTAALFSGTEPVLRLAVEADTPEKAKELIAWLQAIRLRKTARSKYGIDRAEDRLRYGHFDNENREYVIDRVDVPVSWTNYHRREPTCAQ